MLFWSLLISLSSRDGIRVEKEAKSWNDYLLKLQSNAPVWMTVDGDVVMFAWWLEECRYQNRNRQANEPFCGLNHTTSRSGYESDVNLQVLYVSWCHVVQQTFFIATFLFWSTFHDLFPLLGIHATLNQVFKDFRKHHLPVSVWYLALRYFLKRPLITFW